MGGGGGGGEEAYKTSQVSSTMSHDKVIKLNTVYTKATANVLTATTELVELK